MSCNDSLKKGAYFFILYFARKDTNQDTMVNAVEKFVDIKMDRVLKSSAVLLCLLDCFVSSFLFSAGVAVINEAFLKKIANNIDNSMM